MSHELRTPLNSVIALSGVLNRRLINKIPEDEYSYLGIIEKNGKQLLSLINDILDLSRIEAGKEEISYSRFSFPSLVNGILESLAPIAEQKEIALINHVQSDFQPIISDSSMCHHILQNIISNALKFTEHGSVEVSAEIEGGKLRIEVKDTGIGISPEHLPYIFDEFRQADGRSSRKYGGTGLGLAIAKKYTHLLHGSIDVMSQEGSGSSFVITLPPKPQIYEFIENDVEMARGNYSASYTISDAGIGKNLLVVEDSEPQIIQLTDILNQEGYTIQVARNGKDALELIRKSIPDALILDLMMPEVDGFEVLRSIRGQADTGQIPVLILSAKHITKEELSFLSGNNVYQLIQKGDVNRNELLTHVNNMMNTLKTVQKITEKKTSAKRSEEKATILLIEDNDDSTTTIKALVGEKYVLVNTSDGLTGIEITKKLNPNLILLDISLSGIEGFSVLNEIKKDKQSQHIPVIALTAHAMKGDRENIMDQGFDDYISKPIDHRIFDETIAKWMNGNKMNGNPK
jgi:CheY-like chemotaxis protein